MELPRAENPWVAQRMIKVCNPSNKVFSFRIMTLLLFSLFIKQMKSAKPFPDGSYYFLFDKAPRQSRPGSDSARSSCNTKPHVDASSLATCAYVHVSAIIPETLPDGNGVGIPSAIKGCCNVDSVCYTE